MLNIPTPFPFPGAAALLGERPVVIHSILADDRLLVTGDGITRRVDRGEISDARLSNDPLADWFAERTEPAAGDRFTPMIELLDDCRRFMAVRGARPMQLPTSGEFSAFLDEQGIEVRRRRPLMQQWAVRCAMLALKPIGGAA